MAAAFAKPDDGPKAETRRTSDAVVQCSTSQELVQNKAPVSSRADFGGSRNLVPTSSSHTKKVESRPVLTLASFRDPTNLEKFQAQSPPSSRIPKKSPKAVPHFSVSQNDLYLTTAIHFAARSMGIYRGKGREASEFWAKFFPKTLRVPQSRSDYAYKKIVDQYLQIGNGSRYENRVEAFT